MYTGIFNNFICEKYTMGRLWNRIKNGVRKVGRFIGGIAGKVGSVAGALSNIPIIGGVASTVARGANLVSKVGNGVANLIDKGEAIRQKYQPTIDKVKDAAKAVHDSGVLDKVSGGRYSKLTDKLRQIQQNGIRPRVVHGLVRRPPPSPSVKPLPGPKIT